MEQTVENPQIRDKVDNLLYLIELGKPSANNNQKSEAPQSLIRLYFETVKQNKLPDLGSSIQEMEAP